MLVFQRLGIMRWLRRLGERHLVRQPGAPPVDMPALAELRSIRSVFEAAVRYALDL
jgi:hypothetical protein